MSSYNSLYHPYLTHTILPRAWVVAPSLFANTSSNDAYLSWTQQTPAMGLGSVPQHIHQHSQTPYYLQGNTAPYGFAPIFPPNHTSHFSLPEPRTSRPNRILPHPSQSAPFTYQASLKSEVGSCAHRSVQNNQAYCFSPPSQSYARARPIYMQEIEQLNNLDKTCRLNKVQSLNAYTFSENKFEKWQTGECYADLVKRLLYWSNLEIIKGFALKGIVMTPKTFNKTLCEYMDATDERDFINTLLNKWQHLTQFSSKDGVRDFDLGCHIEALREINIRVEVNSLCI